MKFYENKKQRRAENIAMWDFIGDTAWVWLCSIENYPFLSTNQPVADQSCAALHSAVQDLAH